MERGDLVVVEVGGDERLRGQRPGHDAHVVAREPERVEPLEVRRGVVADGRHDERLAAEQLQAVADVAGAAAELAPQLRHEERDVQDVDLVGRGCGP